MITRRAWIGLAAASMASAQGEPIRLPRKVRLALIGTYGPTSLVINELKRLPDVNLVAAADPNQESVRRSLDRKNAASARTYADYREMLRQEKPDVVGIFNSNPERADAAFACVESGAHIFAEKPLALDIPTLRRLREAVRKSEVGLTCALPMRYYPHYQKMHELAAAGSLGEVIQMSAQKSYKVTRRPEWFLERETYGGTIPWIGTHMIDLMRWTSGRELTEAMSFQARIGFPELGDIENTTATVFRLDNNGSAALHMDYLRPPTAPTHGDDRLRLAGTEGVVEYQASTGLVLMTRDRKPEVIEDLPAAQSVFVGFLQHLYHNQPPAVSAEDAFRVTEIALLARDAAESHRIEKL